MIDSSGRRALRANGTVLDLLPIGQAISVIGTLLVVLFVLVKPEASQGLGLFGRILYWALHVGLGLVALRFSSHWLASRKYLPSGMIAALLVSACGAIAIALPGYLALDAVFAQYIVDLDPDPTASSSLLANLAQEAMDLAPWFLAAWLLINLPVLLPRPMLNHSMNELVEHEVLDQATENMELGIADAQPAQMSSDSESGNPEVPVPEQIPNKTPAPMPENDQESTQLATRQIDSRGERFLSSLPGIVGKDVVAIGSDLHYLNVWTVSGRTTVLGNLKDVAADLGSAGMQIHRSHWVAHAHVRRIIGTASDAACILSNELRVPISRRRWKAVREQYGRGVVHANEGVPESAQT